MPLEKERTKVQKETRSSWRVIRELIFTFNVKYTGIEFTIEIKHMEDYTTRIMIMSKSALKLSQQFC